jgi:hypothetical protein
MSMLTALGSKEAERKIITCDLHASQQTIAMLDRETGEIVEKTLKHEAGTVRELYAALPAPVVVGLEATGAMGWCLFIIAQHFQHSLEILPSWTSAEGIPRFLC